MTSKLTSCKKNGPTPDDDAAMKCLVPYRRRWVSWRQRKIHNTRRWELIRCLVEPQWNFDVKTEIIGKKPFRKHWRSHHPDVRPPRHRLYYCAATRMKLHVSTAPEIDAATCRWSIPASEWTERSGYPSAKRLIGHFTKSLTKICAWLFEWFITLTCKFRSIGAAETAEQQFFLSSYIFKTRKLPSTLQKQNGTPISTAASAPWASWITNHTKCRTTTINPVGTHPDDARVGKSYVASSARRFALRNPGGPDVDG